MHLRDLTKTREINRGDRSLMESVLYPEVIAALNDWKAGGWRPSSILIGGVALSFHAKPRTTQDIDILFLTPDAAPDAVPGFRRHRAGAFEHIETGIEVEIITPQSINVRPDLIKAVVDDAVENDGIRIASVSGLVALKLQSLRLIDKADIVQLINTGRVNLDPFPLSQAHLVAYEGLRREATKEAAGGGDAL